MRKRRICGKAKRNDSRKSVSSACCNSKYNIVSNRKTCNNNDFFMMAEGLMHKRVHGCRGSDAPRCEIKTAINRRTSINHFKSFVRLYLGSSILPVRQITPHLMQQFEAYLFDTKAAPFVRQCMKGQAVGQNSAAAGQPVSRNTVSLYMRSLSALYTMVCQQLHIRSKHPFAYVFTGNAPSKKGRSLTEDEMVRVVNFQKELAQPKAQQEQPNEATTATGQGKGQHERRKNRCRKEWETLAHHLFLLSFYFCGMPLTDLLHLRRHQIDQELLRLVYQRRKTGEGTQLGICPEAMNILLQYIRDDMKPDDFVFPVLKSDEGDSYRHYQQAMSACNRALHRIGTRLRLHIRLTTYVARHSWANIACHNYNIQTPVISLALAHKSEKTTYHYLDRADFADLRQAQSKFMDGFRKKCKKISRLV